MWFVSCHVETLNVPKSLWHYYTHSFACRESKISQILRNMVTSLKHCPCQSNSSDHRMTTSQYQYRWNLMLLRIQMKVIRISSEHWLPSWEKAAGDMMCLELVKGWGKIWMIPGIQWCWLLAAYLKIENTHFIEQLSFLRGLIHPDCIQVL